MWKPPRRRKRVLHVSRFSHYRSFAFAYSCSSSVNTVDWPGFSSCVIRKQRSITVHKVSLSCAGALMIGYITLHTPTPVSVWAIVMGGQGVLIPFVGLLLVLTGVSAQRCAVINVVQESDSSYAAEFKSQSETPSVGFDVVFTFDHPVTSVTNRNGHSEMINETHVRMYEDYLLVETGAYVHFSFEVFHSGGSQPEVTAVDLNGQDACDGSLTWATEAPYTNPCQATGRGPYDYEQALCMSFLFYEAQRSGVLPPDQRVKPWRWDSALHDGADVGHDLTGGYYDAGDHVKFGFPMASTTTVLAWGLIDFPMGYEQTGQTEYGRAAVKWATDYFLKAHTAEYELYGQVGKGLIDHAFWCRPEDMLMDRPAYKIDREHPGKTFVSGVVEDAAHSFIYNTGTELACETAAALAAASMVFKGVDDEYSAELLRVAKELYAFGDEYRMEYHFSIPDVMDFYRDWSGYGDELVWGALWLYRATGEEEYLGKAQKAWDEFGMGYEIGGFGWDDKSAAVYALGSKLDPGNPQYAVALTEFLRHIREDLPYTPGGLVFINKWGSNRHAANAAFLALWATKYGDHSGGENLVWAVSQIDFILGAAGHSFVVGFGEDPPLRAHHRSASCPSPPDSCAQNNWGYEQPGPNPHILYGGIVGGPSENGDWEDDRSDYVRNEVACDYNAGYTGALAAIIEMKN
ncbi:Endoglucanase E-4 [Chionoecetes opilio]|uniref:Endoglucanase n=1 Tax=Chionoecetes opilio TaxID=41210 RepID=A0A8J5D3B8_CHIOP|nr:Endoglucanase E-4 [Chionoecetes opilio]